MKAVLAACTVCHLNQHYERTDQVFSALPSRPTYDVSVDFLDMSAKDRACYNAALSSLVLACSTAQCARSWRYVLAGEYRHPYSNTF